MKPIESLEEAEIQVDKIYQKRCEKAGFLGEIKLTRFEWAAVILLREEVILKRELEKEKETNKELQSFHDDFESGKITDYPMFKQRYISKDKIKAIIEEYKKQIGKMEKDDVGIGFTLGKEWSDLKAKIEFGQSLLEKE